MTSSSSNIDTRPDVVEALVLAVLDSIMDTCKIHDATGGEAYSAIFTMALRAVVSARNAGESLTQIRAAVEKIWKELPEERAS